MSPFDPTAILDEIQRLVPGYDVSRSNLLAGNSQHMSLAKAGPGIAHGPELAPLLKAMPPGKAHERLARFA